MKSLIVYTSQTGFTKRYAEWLQEDIGADLMTVKEASKKTPEFFDSYDAIVYGGWAMAGKIQKSSWFIDRIEKWKDKKLAMFCVGASPIANPDVEEFLAGVLTEEQKKYAKVFYCQGGLDYDKMPLVSKMAMKAFAASLKKNKNATDKEKEMAEYISKSYDISDKRYIIPIVSYLKGKLEYRSIKKEEADEAVSIEQICFPPNEACSEKSMKERIDKASDMFLVAYDNENGKIAGFLNGIATNEIKFRDEFFTDCNLHDKNGENVMLLGLDVLPEYRMQGIGRELIMEYAGRESARGRKALVLTCLDNKVKMYEHMGFTDNGIADSTWGGEEWHEMIKHI